MVRPRVTRAVNPQRKLSAAQIRAGFGGKRRRNSLRASKPHKHRRRKAAASNPTKKRRRAKAKSKNPRTRIVYRTRTKTKVQRVYVRPKANPRKKNRRRAKAKRRNPGQYLLTMSPVGNPQRKRRRSRKNMAKTRRRARAKSNSGRKNPTRRRRVARRNTHRHSNRSRNPFGQSSSQLLKKGAGVFVGFSIGKNIPPMLGTTANSSATMTLLTTAITAGIAAWAARKFAPGDFAEGVLWGGVGATINMAWNAWAPSFIPSGYVGVSGLRDFVPGGFPLPQVPVYRRVAAAPAATPAMPAGSGTQLGAWGRAF
jgi:hypothetical protein